MWLGVRHGRWVWGIGVQIRFQVGLAVQPYSTSHHRCQKPTAARVFRTMGLAALSVMVRAIRRGYGACLSGAPSGPAADRRRRQDARPDDEAAEPHDSTSRHKESPFLPLTALCFIQKAVGRHGSPSLCR